MSGGLPGEVGVHDDPAAVAEAAARWVAERSAAAHPFRIAVSGGSTPRALFETLAAPAMAADIDWDRWHVFFADERAAPPDDEQSNYRLLRDTLLNRVGISPDQVHRMPADRADLESAAAEYAALLERECGRPPRLDVVLLGLGEDGHTASLFPGTPALDVDDAWVSRGRATYAPFDRMTLTFPAINAAAAVAFLVTGAAKGAALRAVGAGAVPAARVRPSAGTVTWFLDRAAADGAG